MKDLKVKPLTKQQLIISFDRLTRFKQGKYFRVFSDILSANLITPKLKKSEIEKMEASDLRELAQYIINYSLQNLGYESDGDYSINEKLLKYEQTVFYLDDYTKILMNNKIDYKSFINLIDSNCVKNLQWLKALAQNGDIKKAREQNSFIYPICQVVIVEGATEEILLPEFARICNYDFAKQGIYLISAGGKNQVVKMYYKLSKNLKLPIFVLLDKDAHENLEEITPCLREIDKIHILKCGEFEDLLSKDLILRTIEFEYSNISIIEKGILDSNESMTKILEEFFRTRGMHEFKKAEFANLVKNNLRAEQDVTPEIKEIIEEIKYK